MIKFGDLFEGRRFADGRIYAEVEDSYWKITFGILAKQWDK